MKNEAWDIQNVLGVVFQGSVLYPVSLITNIQSSETFYADIIYFDLKNTT